LKYLQLVWFGIWRKPGRTVLIFLQVAVAFGLFGVLQGLKSGVDHAISETRADLLLVFSRLSMGDPLPVAVLDRIRTVPGVRVAIPVDLSWGTYQKPDQGLVVVAITPEKDWTAAFTFEIPPERDSSSPISRRLSAVTRPPIPAPTTAIRSSRLTNLTAPRAR
jgi:putative ABC transport system permease protein